MPLKLRRRIDVDPFPIIEMATVGRLLWLPTNVPKEPGLYLLFTNDLNPSTVLRVYRQTINNGALRYCVGHFSTFTAKPEFNGYYWSEPIPRMRKSDE